VEERHAVLLALALLLPVDQRLGAVPEVVHDAPRRRRLATIEPRK
jgi:hypothetical protein